MNTIFMHTVQNTGTGFLHDLLLRHPDVASPPAGLIPEGHNDSVWRDSLVKDKFEELGDWGKVEAWLAPSCPTPYTIVWCHNVAWSSRFTDYFLKGGSPQPSAIVGAMRDPLLTFITYLARVPHMGGWYPVPWSVGRCIPWLAQYRLWFDDAIRLLRVDEPEETTPEDRVAKVAAFCGSIGLDMHDNIRDAASEWKRKGSYVAAGSRELETSPIKGMGADLLQAFNQKDRAYLLVHIEPWVNTACLLARACRPMFDAFHYDLWWYQEPIGAL